MALVVQFNPLNGSWSVKDKGTSVVPGLAHGGYETVATADDRATAVKKARRKADIGESISLINKNGVREAIK